jgi:mRNA interferase MazF
VKGDVVVVPFPFSDLSQAKRRPAVVVAELQGDDRILCQITSQTIVGHDAITVQDAEFESGGLRQLSNIRPDRLFTADEQIILYSAGRLTPTKVEEVVNKIVDILRRSRPADR